jgi:hypothetical protein
MKALRSRAATTAEVRVLRLELQYASGWRCWMQAVPLWKMLSIPTNSLSEVHCRIAFQIHLIDQDTMEDILEVQV